MNAHSGLPHGRGKESMLQNRGLLPLALNRRALLPSSAAMHTSVYASRLRFERRRRGLCRRDTDRWVCCGLRNLYLLPSSPLSELRKPGCPTRSSSSIWHQPGGGGAAARRADIAIAFAIRAERRASTAPIMPWGRDALIAQSSANANTRCGA